MSTTTNYGLPKKTTNSGSLAKTTIEVLLLVGGSAAVAFLFFWPQFLDGFNHLYGDAYDGTIEAVIISHWHWVFIGAQKWNQTPYFYPHADTLGYNDGLFLFGVIGAVFRAFGADVLRAMEYTHVTLKVIGFLSMYALLRRIDNRPFINTALAIVFAIAINSENGQHLQLLSLCFAPAMLLLGSYALSAFEREQRKQFAALSIVWAILYGAWLLTGYYMAFFFGLFLIYLAVAYAFSDRTQLEKYAALASSNRILVLLFLVAFAVSTVPFLMVYLPKLGQTGGQPLELVKTYTQKPIDILNIGSGSALWGWLYKLVDSSTTPSLFRPGEHMTGFQPIFLVSFVIAGISLFRSRREGTRIDRIALAIFFASVALIISVLEIDGKTLWVAIYRLIPGAKGVRVIARYFMFLMLPMSIIVACWLHKTTRTAQSLVAIVALLLIVEQINLTPRTELEVAPQLAALAQIPQPPDTCKVFYGTNPTPFSSWDRQIVALYGNVQSMLVADHMNMPTVNGITAVLPPGWIFNGWPAETYVARATKFGQENNISGLCGYDIANGKWFNVPK